MPDSFSIDLLAARWQESPDLSSFAALAEGLRKRGDYEMAAMVAQRGLAARPMDIPGLVVLARIRLDGGDSRGAERALRDALRLDSSNPVALRALERFQASQHQFDDIAEDESDQLLFTDDDPESLEPEPLLTESLAVLYHRQGHLDRASEVYSALLERDPENEELRARRDRIASEAEGKRPRPYDSAVSGGRGLRDWLAALAAVTPPTEDYGTAYDAFYRTPASGQSDDVADFEAFQSWLKGLER